MVAGWDAREVTDGGEAGIAAREDAPSAGSSASRRGKPPADRESHAACGARVVSAVRSADDGERHVAASTPGRPVRVDPQCSAPPSEVQGAGMSISAPRRRSSGAVEDGASRESARAPSERRSFPGWRWMAVWPAFPVAGYIGWRVGGRVDGVDAALVGGAIPGAGLAGVEWWAAKGALGRPAAWIGAGGVGFALRLGAGGAARGAQRPP